VVDGVRDNPRRPPARAPTSPPDHCPSRKRPPLPRRQRLRTRVRCRTNPHRVRPTLRARPHAPAAATVSSTLRSTTSRSSNNERPASRGLSATDHMSD
jgi:hypothetical protein